MATESIMDKIIADSKAELLEEDTKRNQKGDTQEGIDYDSTWVKEMKWVRHFGDRNLSEIHDAAQWIRAKATTIKTRIAEDNEAMSEVRILTRLGESFDREVDRCSWRLDSVPKETLQCLHGIEAGKPNSRPFGHTAQERSQSKYQSVGHRYLGFCWRAYHMGREEAATRLGMRFTDEQWGLMADVARELENQQLCDRVGQPRLHNNNDIFSEDDNSESGSEGEGEGEEEEEEGGRERVPTAALDQAVFRFMIASIKVRVGGDMYSNAMLCFCAAAGIRRHPLGYMEAYLYTGILAALVWLSRMFFLEAGFENEPRELDAVSIEALTRFRQEHETWMCIGTYTVMSKVINWMAYGKGHRNKTGGTPTVRWSDDGESLVHNGEQMLVRDFQRAACKVTVQADELLNQMLGGTWDRTGPGIDMKRIVDTTVRLGAGQSFVTNEKNGWLDAGPGKVMRSMEASIFDKTTNQWKRAGVRRWMQQLRVFREALMVLVHVWGGQPGRGPEVTTLRHCDTWQVMRNIFLHEGQVMIVTDRDKMKAIRENGRKVARFLPDRIGRMMVAYIAWLLPAERALRRKCKLPEPQENCLEFLWRNGNSKRWDTDRLSSIMIRLLQAEIKMRLGVGRYRVVAIELGRKIRGLVMKQVDGMAGDDDDEDGIEVDPMTGEAADVRGSWNIVWDLQSTHGTKMARQHYAVYVGMPGRLSPEMITTYRSISQLWHQFLMEGDEGRAGWKRKAACDGAAAASKRRKTEPEKEEVEREMVRGLRTLIGPTSTWRSAKQMESMRTILSLRGEQSVICVLPTGAGKSLLFMVPAIMSGGGTSVVVVPFAALMADLVDRARQMGVDVIEFRPTTNSVRESLPRAARMVVVSADTALVPTFHAYVDGLKANGLLQRIFIDEAHTAITDVSYRVKLGELKGLSRFKRPIVLLTATMPVTFERWFRDEMLASSALIVRDRTTKRNCRYEVEQVKPGAGAVDTRVVDLVRRIGSTMVSGQKGIVYCRSKLKCAALAEEIGCGAHHGDMEEAARDEARTSWAAGGRHRWIVATTGLGTGIDIGGIVAVIHAEMPYGLVDFVQQTGRGARREGEEVRSVIIHDGKTPWEAISTDKVSHVNKHQMEMFIKSPGCRREVLSSFMDGVVGEVCADVTGAIPCDRCEPSMEEEDKENTVGIEEQSARGERRASEGVWRAFNKSEGERVAMLTRWLDEVQDICAICHIRNCTRTPAGQPVTLYQRHRRPGSQCEPVKEERYSSIRQKIRFADNSCCFRCKLPSDWCKEARESAGEGEGCMYMDKVLPVALLPMGHSSMKMWVKEKFKIDALDRVVVDECHVLLDGGDKFRPQLRQLGETLRDWGVQKVFLTATLAPGDEEEFFKVAKLSATRVKMFRWRTIRQNIEYRVEMVKAGWDEEEEEEDKRVCRMVREWLNRHEEGRAIVYGGSVERVKGLAETLGCEAYYNKIDTTEGKQRRLRAWIRDGTLIVATNALGMGVDMPDIRLVVHAGMPGKLRDYVQESGRGGGTGRRARQWWFAG
ncbi:ATP-dependent DNA helicase tlh2-like protein [Cladobotryum mycophilum]|uniref:DNA 3'-5' helicase n=1 Tax=Cladobotryum mycophilum TaxID=491253 RepID=A0ABR0SRG2_9HYPO